MLGCITVSLSYWQSEQENRLAAEADQAKREARAEQEALLAEESAVLSKLTAEEIQQVVEIVTKDTFKNLNVSNLVIAENCSL